MNFGTGSGYTVPAIWIITIKHSFPIVSSTQPVRFVTSISVVVYCHSKFSITTRFLFRAQDHNMTNGDFAFFTFRPLRMPPPQQPWMKEVANPDDIPRRRRAYYAVKQVCVYWQWFRRYINKFNGKRLCCNSSDDSHVNREFTHF